MKKLFKRFLILTAFVLATFSGNAKNYYFSSSTGNDNYTASQAQNKATPWASLRKLTQLTTNGVICFAAGDSILFKRGDVFANGAANGYCSAYFWNDGGSYFTAPSGTPGNPIVISNYGDPTLPLPNWLYPTATSPVSTWRNREGRAIIEFAGVHDIIVDGIQSNDYRIAESDKTTPGYSAGWIIGEWSRGTSGGLKNSYNDTNRRVYMVTRFTIRNCVFNNLIYGINGLAGIDSKIMYNTFTNFKSSADTSGTNDVMAAALEGIHGIRCEISHNFIKGAWAKSGRISSTNGLGGVAFDIFNLYNSRICYNTIIDCSGAFEIGNLDGNDTTAGSQYDTIAFNKIINTSNLAYFHGTGFFAGMNHHVAFWNNTFISNNTDRQVGIGFGKDVYGDGQGWAPGTANPWWFCRNPYNTLNVGPMTPTVNTTQGSNIITVSSAAGISVGSVWFTDNDDLASVNYKTVTVTAINGTTLTLSDTSTRTVTGYTCTNETGFYLPVSNQTWSQPSNPPFNNWSGHRTIVQYSTDATIYGSSIDSMFDFRNNIFYWTSGTQGLYDRNRLKRSANIYYYLGGTTLHATSLGGTVNYRGTKERAMTSGMVFKDTSAAHPEDWNLHLNDTSYAKTNGVAISGFTTDFEGNSIVGEGNTPFIGMYKYMGVTPSCTSWVYSPWSLCSNGVQTRTAVGSPSGCIGTPDSALTRSCTLTCTTVYSAWSSCVNGAQTRTYTTTGVGCTVPPIDSLQRACTLTCTSFGYGTWSACVNGIQTRNFSAVPLGCNIGTPPADSISRSCTLPTLSLTTSSITKASCLNRTDGSIKIIIAGGTSPYYTSINSTLVYVQGKTTFSGLLPGTYIIRVKDATGYVVSLTVVVGSRRNRKC